MADDPTLDVVRRRLLGEHERTRCALKRDWVDELYIKYGVAPDQAAALEHGEEDENNQDNENNRASIRDEISEVKRDRRFLRGSPMP